MEKGSRLAIYRLKEVEPKNGKKFYIATVVENVFNSQKPFNNGIEPSFMKAYIFDTSLELEVANFEGGKGENKFSFENITNPEKSIIRVEEFKVETHTKWNFRQQVKENGAPVYETLAYLTKVCKDKEYKTDYMKDKLIQKQIDKLVKTGEKDKVKIKELKNEIKRLKYQIEKQNEIINEAKAELNIIPERKVAQKVRVKEFGDVNFEDM